MIRCHDNKCEIQIEHLKELMNELYKEYPKTAYDYQYNLLNMFIYETQGFIDLLRRLEYMRREL